MSKNISSKIIVFQIAFCSLISFGQSKNDIDTMLIHDFLKWETNKMYRGNSKICIKTLTIREAFLDCSLPKTVNGKPTIPDWGKGIICDYLNSEDIAYMKKQIEISKNLRLSSFVFLAENLLDCNTIESEIVIKQFSIPIFSIDKRTALFVYTDKVSNTGVETYIVDLYKKDDNNNWNLFKELFRLEED